MVRAARLAAVRGRYSGVHRGAVRALPGQQGGEAGPGGGTQGGIVSAATSL